MAHKLYQTDNPYFRIQKLDVSKLDPIKGDLADFLLDFESLEDTGCPLRKVISVPGPTDSGLIVRACQVFYGGWGTYVYEPEENEMHEFKEALITFGKNRGFFGQLPPEEKRFLVHTVSKDFEKFKDLEVENVPNDVWYHFTGTPRELVDVLKTKCESPNSLFKMFSSKR